MADNYKQLTGLTQGTEYEFRVIAIGDGTTYTDSAASATQNFTTLIKLATPAPSLAKTTDSVTATWSAVANATGYVVAYNTGSGSFTEETVATTTFSLDNLAEDTTVVIKVKAISSQTTVYEESDFSSEVTETTQTTLGVPVMTLTRTTSTLTATWGAVANATGYTIAYKTGAGAFTEATLVNPTFTLDQLAEGVTYIFKSRRRRPILPTPIPDIAPNKPQRLRSRSARRLKRSQRRPTRLPQRGRLLPMQLDTLLLIRLAMKTLRKLPRPTRRTRFLVSPRT